MKTHVACTSMCACKKKKQMAEHELICQRQPKPRAKLLPAASCAPSGTRTTGFPVMDGAGSS